MEAIERYSGIFQGDEIRVTRRFTDFAPGEAILPNDVLLFSDAQYRRRQPANEDVHAAAAAVRSFGQDRMVAGVVAARRALQISADQPAVFLLRAAGSHMHADSNGCAAGNTLEEAIVQGFLELVERDSYAIWWYNRLQRTEVDLDQFNDPYVRDLRTQLAETGRRLWVLDITSDLGIPSYVAIIALDGERQEYIEFGSGAHFDPRIALLRALTELNQFLSIGLMGGGDAATSRASTARPAAPARIIRI